MTHTQAGRPLRFLLLVMLLWTGGRMAMAVDWYAPPPVMTARADSTKPRLPLTPPMQAAFLAIPAAAQRIALTGATRRPAPSALPAPSVAPALDYIRFSAAFANRRASGPWAMDYAPGTLPAQFAAAPASTPIPAVLPPRATSIDRWSLSTWLFWRDGSPGGYGTGPGQLGGSQGGIRIDRRIASSRLTLYARLTSALQRPRAPEAAMGIALQPSRQFPVSFAAERRVALGSGGRNAFALIAAGGIGPVDLPGALTLDGYGQAGIVGFNKRDAFADGRLSLLHPLRPNALAAGITLSGGAQPHVARLDIGPQVEARLPIGGRPARLAVEWRERIAGDARPNSGLAVTLAANF